MPDQKISITIHDKVTLSATAAARNLREGECDLSDLLASLSRDAIVLVTFEDLDEPHEYAAITYDYPARLR